MAQKKPTPPFPVEQHSSSSDEEEEVSKGEEEASRIEQSDSSSDDEVQEEVSSESEEETEEEEEEETNVTPVAPVKPVVVVQSPPKVRPAKNTQQPDLAPATAPASAVTVGKKRPGEESMAVSKKIKKTRVAEEVVKKVGDYPKTPQRVFTEDDEIALLKALLNYSAEKSIYPINSTDFHDFVKNSTDIDVTKKQLSHKISSMKSKYKNNATKKKETFGNDHDQSCYDISKKIWGNSSAGSNLKTTRKSKRIPPGLQIPQVVVEEPNISLSQVSKTRDFVGMMCLNDDDFKQVLDSLSDDEARAAFEHKLKNIVTDELKLNYKRLELSRELMKSSMDDALGRHRG
ncbi:hypothetical protein QQ045_011646 [Rhodiola kirilowii]